ncbi:MAG: YfhO family protein [Phycisphaerae bacterium]|nr:YfhO family protein [Phycisphaerae bacterium]
MPSAAPRRVLVPAAILILPAVILAGAWRLGGVSALEDDLIYYLPIRQYIAERIRAGEFPLWNPLVAMGSSIAADPQSGLWYPPTYLFLILPPLVAYPLTLILHFALAGGGMYRFLRASRHDWRAALLGAVAFEFCGYLVAHRAHLTIHHAVAWLPWILYGWRRFADTGRIRHGALASAAFGMQLLVQHVQISIITAVLVTGYVAAVLVRWRPGGRASCPPWVGSTSYDQEGEQEARSIGRGPDAGATQMDERPTLPLARWWVYPLGMTVGAMLAGIQLIPTWLHYAGSVRGVPNYYLFTENSWLPTSGLMLLFPMLFGARTPNVWSQPWWGPSHFCEQSAYASILILVLAAASLRLVRAPHVGQRRGMARELLLRGLKHLRECLPVRGETSSHVFAARSCDPQPESQQKLWPSAKAALATGWQRLPYGWNREAAFWWGACLLALLIALGDLTPLSKLLFHVPVYRSLRVPARWILVWSVVMPVLASMVVSVLLKGTEQARQLAGAVRFTVMRVLPAAALAGLLLLAIAVEEADEIAKAFPTPKAWPKIAGLMLAGRLDNPAIWWPILMMIATGWSLLRWLQTRRPGAFALMWGVFLIDLAGVAAFVDVDVQTYARRDLLEQPPLAREIHKLGLRPGDRLLVPRVEASYDRPIEVLWPQSNLRYGIAVFNGYGPLWPAGSRMMFRFMPWGSSEEMLALLRNIPLLRAMGVRFIAVRSPEERELLRAACSGRKAEGLVRSSSALPAGGAARNSEGKDVPGMDRHGWLPGTEQIVPVRYGRDLLWGPVSIPQPGLYELSFDVQPVKDVTSRWFVRLETPDKEEIDRTRTVEPADMVAGPRRMRFLYHFDRPVASLMIRIKSESGQALSAGRATFQPMAVDSEAGDDGETIACPPFIHRADLPGHVSLYELPDTRPLVYWAQRVEAVPDLVTAIDRMQALVGAEGTGVADDPTVVEQLDPGVSVPMASDAELRFTRPSGHEVRVFANSASGGLVVFNESHDSGWRATVDGQETPVLRVNGVCQGVIVPPGAHEVLFAYRPPGLKSGMAISACAAALLLLSGVSFRRIPRSARESAGRKQP